MPEPPEIPATAPARDRPFGRPFEWIAATLFTALIAAVTAHHEMWRDEVNVWLFARDTSSPLELLWAIRYEGHPPLWHLLVWPIAHLATNPAWMQVLHVAIAAASGWLVLCRSPFSWPIRILLVGGYFFTYEWAAIARNYAIAALLVFGICTLYEHRRTKFVAIGALLGLLATSHASGLILAVAIAGMLTLELVLSLRRGDASIPVRRFATGMAVALIGVGLAIAQARPPRDARFLHAPRMQMSGDDAVKLASAVISGYLPVPVDNRTFWNSNVFVDGPSRGRPLRIPEGGRIPAALLLVGFGVLLLAPRPWILFAFVPGTAALLAFAHLVHYGSVRNHGFLFLALVAALWMSFAHPAADRARSATAFLDRHRMKAFGALLAVHVFAALIAIRNEWIEPFSQGKAAAEWIREKIPNLDSVVFVGDRAPAAATVVGYLGLERMYYPDREGFGSYILYERLRTPRRTMAAQIYDVMAEERRPAVLVLNRRLEDTTGFATPPLLLQRFLLPIQPDENFWIYAVRPDEKRRRTAERAPETEKPANSRP